MFNISADTFVCYLRDTFLGASLKDQNSEICVSRNDGSRISDALHVCLDLRIHSSRDDNDDNIDYSKIIKCVHFIITGRTSVFVTLTDNIFLSSIPLDQFENISNNDSCWRDAISNYFCNTYYKMKDELGLDLEYKDVTDYVMVIGTVHQLVRVTTKLYIDESTIFTKFRKKLLKISPKGISNEHLGN